MKIKYIVLIVAKCNVNSTNNVPCCRFILVLIVAKCNVNLENGTNGSAVTGVLIVAKCNVNVHRRRFLVILGSINSSKV